LHYGGGKVGYTQGTFDLFHIGHLNLLNHAREHCNFLIVGVNSDDLVKDYKHKIPVIKQEERAEIVRSIRGVDACVITTTLDKMDAHAKYKFNTIFIGDDWKGNPRWEQTKVDMEEIGVELIFLPYTNGVSTTAIKDTISHV